MKTGNRLEYLDTVRGLAALGVVWFHYKAAYGFPFQLSGFARVLLAVTWDGEAAVSLFFVLSGFVLSLRYFTNSGAADFSRFNAGAFAFARFMRIWPPYVAVTLLSALALNSIFTTAATIPSWLPWRDQFWSLGLPASTLPREMTLLLTSADGARHLVPQAWSLAVELVLSVMVPVLAYLAAAIRPLFLSAVILAFVGSISYFSDLTGPIFIFHFVVGVLFAKLYRKFSGHLASEKVNVLLLFAGALLYGVRHTVFPYVFPTGRPGLEHAFWYLSAVGAFLILFSVVRSSALKKVLGLGPLAYLGRISYSLYLCHMIVLLGLTPHFLSSVNRLGLNTERGAWLAGWVFTTFGAILLSAVLYRLVEVPSMALGKRGTHFEWWVPWGRKKTHRSS